MGTHTGFQAGKYRIYCSSYCIYFIFFLSAFFPGCPFCFLQCSTCQAIPLATAGLAIDATYPPSCGACHGNASNPAPDGSAYPDTLGSHGRHVIQLGYDCGLCHNTPEGPGGTGHFDFVQPADIVLAVTDSRIGPNATYDPATKTCANVYCHNPNGTASPASPPKWGDSSTVTCGSCHAVLTHAKEDLEGSGRIDWADLATFSHAWETASATNPASPDFNADGQVETGDLLHLYGIWHTGTPPPSFPGSHDTHFNKVYGPGLTDCLTCHPDNTTGHSAIDGVVQFADNQDLAQTEVCNHCHGVTADTKPVWGGTVVCIDCHKANNPANSMADGSGIFAPERTTRFTVSGHGLSATDTFPLTGNPGPGFINCVPCHNPRPSVGRHISHVKGDEKRFRDIVLDDHPFTSRSTEQCLSCHLPGQTEPGGLGVDASAEGMIHSGAVTGHYNSPGEAPVAFPAYGNESDYSLSPGYQCADCHDPHGTGNLSMIRTLIDGKVGGESNPQAVTLTPQDPRWARGGTDGGGVCEACHQAGGPAHPDTFHPGNHNIGQNCRDCHDNHANSFRPSGQGGSCVGCHSVTQGSRRAVTSDFERMSHHVIGSVTDSQCIVCHDQATHMDGTVDLVDYNNLGSPIAYTSPSSLEPFCIGCHDTDGAAGNHSPFNDSGQVPNIAQTWPASMHKTAGQTCADCHDNGHGSQKRNLLAPADVPATLPSLTEEEEGFCFGCHTANETEYALTSHHDVPFADQQAHGSKVECVNCHNPHAGSTAQPLIDPDNPASVWTGRTDGFCLRCHDGQPPAGVVFPGSSAGSGYNKNRWPGSGHEKSGQVVCLDCHRAHGSTEASLKTSRYDQIDPSTYTYGSQQYALCWQCHSEDKVVRTSGGTNPQNAFGTRHDKHVRGERAACALCHDVHASYDNGEDGLINFAYALKRGWNLSLGSNTLSSAFQDTGTNRGSCYFSGCHGEGHNPESYTGVEVSTLK